MHSQRQQTKRKRRKSFGNNWLKLVKKRKRYGPWRHETPRKSRSFLRTRKKLFEVLGRRAPEGKISRLRLTRCAKSELIRNKRWRKLVKRRIDCYVHRQVSTTDSYETTSPRRMEIGRR